MDGERPRGRQGDRDVRIGPVALGGPVAVVSERELEEIGQAGRAQKRRDPQHASLDRHLVAVYPGLRDRGAVGATKDDAMGAERLFPRRLIGRRPAYRLHGRLARHVDEEDGAIDGKRQEPGAHQRRRRAEQEEKGQGDLRESRRRMRRPEPAPPSKPQRSQDDHDDHSGDEQGARRRDEHVGAEERVEHGEAEPAERDEDPERDEGAPARPVEHGEQQSPDRQGQERREDHHRRGAEILRHG